ncbi:hypothetical protein KD050_00900 [Psychrobacillus sp. INOP01]|uniref:hypothetical protein n=1 Tax=Psychrobacillus sp. INOP01 TaxID=2829187 RepID=UPI001BA68E31|nr:hypothetical protein [Psychrobacillus sp. INOP01]QUG41894.1 hypothetical protein KD050_00900 [Psychrobacillus sp. INOP01]
MNIVFIIILVFSLLVSTLTSIWLLKMKNEKWLARLVAFFVNTLILSIATVILYKLDVQTFHKQTEGVFGSLGIVVLVFFVPIITFINFYILEFVRNRSMSLSN